MNIVFFDFDGTLTSCDTLRLFANYLAKQDNSYYKLFLFYISLLFYKLRLFNDKSLKEAFLKLFIAGKEIEEVEKFVHYFNRDILKDIINKAVIEKLRNHISRGDQVYIISANFDFFLKPLIKEWNLSGIICTETAKKGRHFTGEIIGETCKGENKVKKIIAILGEDVLKNAIAYGDAEDSSILNKVGRSIKIG